MTDQTSQTHRRITSIQVDSDSFIVGTRPNHLVVDLVNQHSYHHHQQNLLQKAKKQATSLKYQEIMKKFRENWQKKEEYIKILRSKEALKDKDDCKDSTTKHTTGMKRIKQSEEAKNMARYIKQINSEQVCESSDQHSQQKTQSREIELKVEEIDKMHIQQKKTIQHNWLYNVLYSTKNLHSRMKQCKTSCTVKKRILYYTQKKSTITQLTEKNKQKLNEAKDQPKMNYFNRYQIAKYRYKIPFCAKTIQFLASKASSYHKERRAKVDEKPIILLNSKSHLRYAQYLRKKFAQRPIYLD